MASTLQSWLLGLTLILLCLLRLSTTSPPISICADSEVPDINAVDRQTEGGFIPFEDLSVSDFQPNSKRRRITIDFFGDLGDLGDRLSSDSGTQADDVAHVDIPIKSADAGSSGLHREWRGSPVSHSAIDWSKHAIAGTQGIGDRAHFVPSSRLEPFVFDFPGGLDSGHVEPTSGSKKSSRDNLEKPQLMKEKQITDQITSGEPQDTHSHRNEMQESNGAAFNKKPEVFEIKSLDEKWAHLLAMAKISITNQNKQPDMKKINQQLDATVGLVQYMLRNESVDKTIELDGLPITVITAHHHSEDQTLRLLLIKLEGIRPVPGARRKRMEDVKNRMAKILEALEYFHQLAREQGVDKKIFGPQIKNTDTKLNQWFYDILFKKTEDSYPLFGQFEIKLTSVFSPENLFGSLQKEISKVIMGWKRPKLENIYEVALSLLGYWYQTTALKLGRADLKNNPETYWNLMAQLTVDRSPQGGLFSVEYNEGEDFFSTNLKRYIVEAKTHHQWEPLFVFLNSRRERNFGSSVTKDIKNRIEEKLRSSGLSRGLDATSKTKIADVPIYLIPSLQVKDTPIMQKVSIILSSAKQWKRRKWDEFDLFQRRIFLIFDSLDILHEIVGKRQVDTKILGTAVTDTHTSLMNWFFEVLFGHDNNSLPIFGTVQIPFPPPQPTSILFGSAQKYLSRMLTNPGNLSKTQANKIALLLLGFWYEETALKHSIKTLGEDQPHSYWNCMNRISQEIRNGFS
ncbi:hypothetical protein PGT21_011203 [Puccinia graminis f. sp. tritici]|uniref:Uncharacterized protein n=1 Tax=Puccinia graminis f. sp. tritici TaxID=56615 RepID=A0A5B0NPD6_PUCGR|nr:hypothetical protein PGTUg99_014034 [Puccinia graminis f. sp. tritici]KAA1090703.1 hypothetical protein PGT21_011203 [Puccinia graminis f. sp. tritici]